MNAYRVTYQITKVVHMTIFADSEQAAREIAETEAATEDAYEYASYQSPAPEVKSVVKTYFPHHYPKFNDRT